MNHPINQSLRNKLTSPSYIFLWIEAKIKGFRSAWVQRRRRQKVGIKYKGVRLGTNVVIQNRNIGKIEFKGHSLIEGNVSICFSKFGDHTPVLKLGDNIRLGKWCDIGCTNEIILEDSVLFAPYVHISDRDHGYEDVTKAITFQPIVPRGPIRIGAGTWVGFRAQILGKVDIGKHCVIAAGSVVTKDIPDYCVVGGNPARILKRYNFETQKWERVKENKDK